MRPGDAVEVRQQWAYGHPKRWTAGYRLVAVETAGTVLVTHATGHFAGIPVRFDATDVRPIGGAS